MARILLLTPFIFFVSSIAAQKYSPEIETQFRSLKWLESNWERTNIKPGTKAIEKWHAGAPYELRGLGVTIKGQDTVFLEKIIIIIKEGNIYYVADVKENKEPVYFKFTSVSSTGFVCENPQHDFPKKIEYRLIDSTLTVIISAGNKSQEYLFVRR